MKAYDLTSVVRESPAQYPRLSRCDRVAQYDLATSSLLRRHSVVEAKTGSMVVRVNAVSRGWPWGRRAELRHLRAVMEALDLLECAAIPANSSTPKGTP